MKVFGTGFGVYDFSIFKEAKLGELAGEAFIFAVLLINCVVFLNFIIAILADTYSELQDH